jgi:hypothetical protein
MDPDTDRFAVDDARRMRWLRLLVALMSAIFLIFAISRLVVHDPLSAIGPFLVVLLGGVFLFLSANPQRDPRIQRPVLIAAFVIVPISVLANLLPIIF